MIKVKLHKARQKTLCGVALNLLKNGFSKG